MTSETIVGSRIRSGGLSPASSRGVVLMRLANWSWLIFQVTFGNCFVNSSDSLNGRSKPVSKTALRTTGSVPQLGTAAALADGLTSALADAAGVAGPVDGAVEADGATEAPGAQAPARMARAATMIPGPRTKRRRANDPSGLVLNI